MRRIIGIAVAVLGLCGITSLHAMETDQPSTGLAASSRPRPVTAELIAEHASIQPGGTTRVGVLLTLEPGWHIYAKEPGDAGLPTRIEWFGPAASTFGELPWPPPEPFIDPGDIKTFGYTGSTVLSSTMTFNPPRRTDGGPYEDLRLHAEVRWLACNEVCIPGSTRLDLTLPVSTQPPEFSPHAPRFDQARS